MLSTGTAWSHERSAWFDFVNIPYTHGEQISPVATKCKETTKMPMIWSTEIKLQNQWTQEDNPCKIKFNVYTLIDIKCHKVCKLTKCHISILLVFFRDMAYIYSIFLWEKPMSLEIAPSLISVFIWVTPFTPKKQENPGLSERDLNSLILRISCDLIISVWICITFISLPSPRWFAYYWSYSSFLF